MDILTGERVNGQLADDLRAAHTQLAKQEREIETLRAQYASLQRRHDDTVRAFEACKDSLAKAQHDFTEQGRQAFLANEYVRELHDLALAEQARVSEVRRPH
ncbi:MAG TPA: hypothetical protein VF491_17735 [Vicinamibacterales bacterium]